MPSMFAIYIIEDDEGNLAVRADSHGKGAAALSLGLDVLQEMICTNDESGGDILFMLPIDRCERVQ